MPVPFFWDTLYNSGGGPALFGAMQTETRANLRLKRFFTTKTKQCRPLLHYVMRYF